jgi:hypothetical protein
MRHAIVAPADFKRPEWAGLRVRSNDRRIVYLIDPSGHRRRIPDETTYRRLFRDWSGIADAIESDDVPELPPLSESAMLLRGDASDDVFLVDRGQKRRIRDARVLDKYWFDPARISVVRQALVNHLSLGPAWE